MSFSQLKEADLRQRVLYGVHTRTVLQSQFKAQGFWSAVVEETRGDEILYKKMIMFSVPALVLVLTCSLVLFLIIYQHSQFSAASWSF